MYTNLDMRHAANTTFVGMSAAMLVCTPTIVTLRRRSAVQTLTITNSITRAMP